jgi:hypothetical protein
LLQRRHGLPDAAVEVFKGILFLVILASESYVGRWSSWRMMRVVEARGSAREQKKAAPEASARAPEPAREPAERAYTQGEMP